MRIRIVFSEFSIGYYSINRKGIATFLIYLISNEGEHYDFRNNPQFKGYSRDYNKTIIWWVKYIFTQISNPANRDSFA